jgi:hypothetical protein
MSMAFHLFRNKIEEEEEENNLLTSTINQAEEL